MYGCVEVEGKHTKCFTDIKWDWKKNQLKKEHEIGQINWSKELALQKNIETRWKKK